MCNNSSIDISRKCSHGKFDHCDENKDYGPSRRFRVFRQRNGTDGLLDSVTGLLVSGKGNLRDAANLLNFLMQCLYREMEMVDEVEAKSHDDAMNAIDSWSE